MPPPGPPTTTTPTTTSSTPTPTNTPAPPPPRTPGLSSLPAPLRPHRLHHGPSASQYASHGAALRTNHLTSLQTQLSVFQSLLHQFSLTHAAEIRSNPTFRAEFARMCNAVGVDMLGSGGSIAGKGTGSGNARGAGWFSGVGTGKGSGGAISDFNNELGVRIVEVCRASRSENGGLLPLSSLQSHLSSGKGRGIGGAIAATSDDILRAVSSLAPLSPGITALTIGHRTYIRSVPKDLGTDQSAVLEAIQVLGFVSVSMLRANLGWSGARAGTVLGDLVGDGLVWVDGQAWGEGRRREEEFWSPAFIGSGGGGG